MTVTLRPYQVEASDAAIEFLTKKSGKPLIVAPVGSGKSLLMAELMRRANDLMPGMRFLSLAHSSVLISQNAAEMARIAPQIPFSFYSDKMGKKSFAGQAVFGTIQSVFRKAWDLPAQHVVIIDEAHMVGKKDTKMYRTLLETLTLANPDIRVVGFTGTPFNSKGGWLHESDDRLFTDIAYSISMTDLIADGYLCPLTTPQERLTRIDTSGVGSLGGDFKLNELEAVSDRPEIISKCVAEMVRLGIDRKKWMVFAVSVKHANHICDEIRRNGISCEVVIGDTSGTDRSKILSDFEHNDLRCVVSVMSLVVGFNNRRVDLIALMRPTKSKVLYVQGLGRGLRTHPDKRDCLVCDFSGAVELHGPVDKITVKRPKATGPKDAPTKGCPRCHEFLFASARICHGCGYVFPVTPGDINLSATASSAAVLSTQKVEPIWTPVDGISYSRHEKVGSPPSLLVEYRCGATRHREWICLQHTGRARAKAMHWWMKRSERTAPFTVEDALDRSEELAVPAQIGIAKEGKYFKVVDWAFAERPTDAALTQLVEAPPHREPNKNDHVYPP